MMLCKLCEDVTETHLNGVEMRPDLTDAAHETIFKLAILTSVCYSWLSLLLCLNAYTFSKNNRWLNQLQFICGKGSTLFDK